MTQDHLALILDAHAAKPDKDGWATVTDTRLLTLYVAHAGVPLTVPRVEAIQAKGGVLRARTQKGETFFLALEDDRRQAAVVTGLLHRCANVQPRAESLALKITERVSQVIKRRSFEQRRRPAADATQRKVPRFGGVEARRLFALGPVCPANNDKHRRH